MRVESTDASNTAVDIQNRMSTERIEQNFGKDSSFVQDRKIGNKLSEKTVIDAIEKANKAIVISRRQLEFNIHDQTKEIMVKVIDTETKEVVREIPPEKVLDMVANILEMAGILVDERR